jgi:hypothetical protein
VTYPKLDAAGMRILGKGLAVLGVGLARRADGRCANCGGEVDTYRAGPSTTRVPDIFCRGCAGRAAGGVARAVADLFWRK